MTDLDAFVEKLIPLAAWMRTVDMPMNASLIETTADMLEHLHKEANCEDACNQVAYLLEWFNERAAKALGNSTQGNKAVAPPENT